MEHSIITDDYILPFGSKKGKKLKNVSDGYLLKLYDVQGAKMKKDLRDYIENRIPALRSTKKLKP